MNIPAVAEAGIPDALGRAPGAVMTSALRYQSVLPRRRLRKRGQRNTEGVVEGNDGVDAD